MYRVLLCCVASSTRITTLHLVAVSCGDHERRIISDVSWTNTDSKAERGKANGKHTVWKNTEPVEMALFDGIDSMLEDVPGRD